MTVEINGIFRKCTLVTKHTYGTCSCSSTNTFLVSKCKATVQTILTKDEKFTAHEKYTIFIQD